MNSVKLKKPAAAVSVRLMGTFLGAEITGIDLTKPLDSEIVAAIAQAHVEHGVVVLPNQEISPEDLMRFGRYFGELSVHPFSTSSDAAPELIVYDNKEGNPPVDTDIWHSDETFRECPAMGTMLCSKIIPDRGGDTTFASMTAIYEGLSDRMQSVISGLEAVHDFLPFKATFPDTREGREKLHYFEEKYRPATHPIVRVHPVNGKKAIYVNPEFTTHIKGMEKDESRTILDLLFRKTLRQEYHYRHRWQPNMVVFWDNRSTQHSAQHDYYPHRRLMERVTIRGDRPAGDGPSADPASLRRYLMPRITDFTDTRLKRQND